MVARWGLAVVPFAAAVVWFGLSFIDAFYERVDEETQALVPALLVLTGVGLGVGVVLRRLLAAFDRGAPNDSE